MKIGQTVLVAHSHAETDLPREGVVYLLHWGGDQYSLARWSDEHKCFYTSTGNVQAVNPFTYSELP